MNSQELAKELNVSETVIKKNFNRFKENQKKNNNLDILRVKVDGEYDYKIVPAYKNERIEQGYLDLQVLDEDALTCNVLLVLSTFTGRGYGGSVKRFLEDYLEIPASQYNKDKLIKILAKLKSKDLILYDTNNKDIAIGLTERTRKQISFDTKFLQQCSDIAQQCGVKSHISVFKVFLGLYIANSFYGTGELITFKFIGDMINLNPRTVSTIVKKLSAENFLLLGKLEYEIDPINETIRCLGRVVDVNGIYVRSPFKMLMDLFIHD